MALSQSALSELLEVFRAVEGVDLIREAVQVALQDLIEFEAAEVIGAGRYEAHPKAGCSDVGRVGAGVGVEAFR